MSMRRKHAPNRVNLTLGDISSRMVQDVPSVLVDLLELAVYVYCADQFRGRGGDTMPELGKKWRRAFRFQVPVRCPEVWNRSDVQDLLTGTLGFLSDDDYAFEFVRHPDPVPPGLQHHLDFVGLGGSRLRPGRRHPLLGWPQLLGRRGRQPDRPGPEGGAG